MQKIFTGFRRFNLQSFESKLEYLKNNYIYDNINDRTKAGNIKNPGKIPY